MESINLNSLSFKRSFWLILVAIALMQVFSISLAAYYGFDLESFPPSYYLYSEIGSIIWFIALTALVLYDLHIHGLSTAQLFNLDISIVKQQITQILKYFSGCAIFVVAISFLEAETELGFENQTPETIFISFIVAVIVAPVCEEIVFRGYLYSSMFSSFKRKKERLVVNAMLFACAHVFLVEFAIGATIPYYIFVLGYLLAKLYEESRSIVPCILLHALNNGLVFGIDLTKLL